MSNIKSLRAKKFLTNPVSFQAEKHPEMKKYPGTEKELWVRLEKEGENVKNLSFFGNLEDEIVVMLESMASLLINKPIYKLDELSIRECEAFLRDRNSESALDGMTETQEMSLKKIFAWIRTLTPKALAKEYHFHSEKGPFNRLKMVDKIKEIKAFLNSPEILTLYANLPAPELVDVEDLTIYIQAPYTSEREKELFEELHNLGVDAFQEESLNFIPEA